MEKSKLRRRALAAISVLGFVASCMLAYRLLYFDISSGIEGHHIRYDISSPKWIIVSSSVLYFISTLVSPMLSGVKYMKSIGLLMFTALVVTQIFYEQYLISVWCFFCALLSIAIFMVIQASGFDRSQIHSILENRIHSGSHDPGL